MKRNQSRKFSSRFKTLVVLEAIREQQTISQLAEKFDLHRSQISNWKKEFLENAHLVFEVNAGASILSEQKEESS